MDGLRFHVLLRVFKSYQEGNNEMLCAMESRLMLGKMTIERIRKPEQILSFLNFNEEVNSNID